MGEPCEGRTTHHAGCACHEARRDAELASLRAQLATATASVQQLRADVELATAQRDAETCRADSAVEHLAAVTADRDEMAARRDDALADYAAVNEYLGGIVRAWQRAGNDERRMADTFVSGLRRELEEARDSGRGEWWEACRGGNPAPLRTELAVLRAQQAPLVACVDALRAAATAAGWRDADATGETLVAWVRRGGAREGAEAVFAAALRTEGVEARERIRQVAALRGLGWLSVDADECGDEDSVCAAQSIAAKIRGREGGE